MFIVFVFLFLVAPAPVALKADERPHLKNESLFRYFGRKVKNFGQKNYDRIERRDRQREAFHVCRTTCRDLHSYHEKPNLKPVEKRRYYRYRNRAMNKCMRSCWM